MALVASALTSKMSRHRNVRNLDLDGTPWRPAQLLAGYLTPFSSRAEQIIWTMTTKRRKIITRRSTMVCSYGTTENSQSLQVLNAKTFFRLISAVPFPLRALRIACLLSYAFVHLACWSITVFFGGDIWLFGKSISRLDGSSILLALDPLHILDTLHILSNELPRLPSPPIPARAHTLLVVALE